MDPKRKRIFIIVIAACILLTAGLLFLNSGGSGGGSGGPAPIAGISDSNSKPSATSVLGDAKSGYSAPVVFPANSNFDFSVLDSSSFKQLKKFDAVVNDPKLLGRDDPFKSY